MLRLYYPLILLVTVKIILHLITGTNYGYHRDEFLYLAVAQRLSVFGNEFPPFIAILGFIIQSLFGESLFVVRLLPALAGGAIVLLAGLTVRELGGGRFAQTLAGIAILSAPLFLRSATLFQPVVFEQLLCTAALYLLVRIAKRDTPHLWYLLGLTLGIGLLNKFTMLIFGFGILTGLLLTSQRRRLTQKEPWLAALIALIAGIPSLTGQIVNGWPLFTHVEYISDTQFVHVGIPDIIFGQINMLHPFTFPVWLAGLYYFLMHREGRRFNFLVPFYLASLIVFLIVGGKSYYLGPVYPVFFAGGAVFIEYLMRRKKHIIIKSVIVGVIIFGGLYILPAGTTLLPPEKLERYILYAELEQVNKTNRGDYGRIPQDFADMFGWEEQVEEIARIFYSLTPEERVNTIIFTNNYGRAGAVDVLGRKHNLPKAVSYVSSYHAWGPGDNPALIAIAVGIPKSFLERLYEEIEHVSTLHHEFAVPEEQHVPVYLCRGPVVDLREVWDELRRP